MKATSRAKRHLHRVCHVLTKSALGKALRSAREAIKWADEKAAEPIKTAIKGKQDA